MANFSLLNFNFLASFFVVLTRGQQFPPVHPLPAPPAAETQSQNSGGNPETTTGVPPSVSEKNLLSSNGPSQMNELGKGGGDQIFTSTPQGNSSDPKQSPANEDPEKNANANDVSSGVVVSSTVAPNASPEKAFGTTEIPISGEGPVVGEVEMWNFAEGMDNPRTTTPSTITPDPITPETTTEHSPRAAAAEKSAQTMLLVASSAIVIVYAFFC